MRKTDTQTLVHALRLLAGEIYSEDGVAQALIREGAERLEVMSAAIDRIKEGGCIYDSEEHPSTCPEDRPDMPDMWCSACIAQKAAL